MKLTGPSMKNINFLSMHFLWLAMVLAISCTAAGQMKIQKRMKFSSAFGSFTIETPKGWKQIEEHGNDSFMGKIALDKRDTLEFDYGVWSSLLKGDKLFLSWSDTSKYVQAKKTENRIDGYDAYISAPKIYGAGMTCLYIDSLKATGPTITKFFLYGNNLAIENQRLFFEAIRTLKFERD
jgi:hypothetical protein